MGIALHVPFSGVVVEFDDHRGTGTVRSEHGVDYFFHCTAVADGSRSIAAGSRVRFTVVPGHQGRWEATDLRPM